MLPSLAVSPAPAAPTGDSLSCLERIASGLSQPLFVTHPPGDSERIFVVEKAGTIKIIRLSDNSVLPTPFLPSTVLNVSTNSEQGLLGLAFHPDYATNGFFYVNYTNSSGNTRIARFQVSTDPDVADAA